MRGPSIPRDTSPLVPTAFSLMNPLPRIPPFSGEGQEVGFVECHEHFDNVANLAGWDDHWRLVHLTSSLKDTATSFYRSCSGDVRNDYKSLLAELKRRFTPVQLTAVQTQLFHARTQREETVEQFVQDLRKLFNRAYAKATQEGPQAEKMGLILLANQFVAGLRPELKRKLIGVDGSLEELVLKARFEEAKGQEFSTYSTTNRHPQTAKEQINKPKGNHKRMEASTPSQEEPQPSTQGEGAKESRARSMRGRCFNCGMEGHLARDCTYEKKGGGEEARGRRPRTISALTTSQGEAREMVESLRRQLQEAEALAAVNDSAESLRSLSGVDSGAGSVLYLLKYTSMEFQPKH